MRFGKKHQPFYRIVAIESTQKRQGNALEYLGFYNPLAKPKLIEVDMTKYTDWIGKGAQPSTTVKSLINKQTSLPAQAGK